MSEEKNKTLEEFEVLEPIEKPVDPDVVVQEPEIEEIEQFDQDLVQIELDSQTEQQSGDDNPDQETNEIDLANKVHPVDDEEETPNGEEPPADPRIERLRKKAQKEKERREKLQNKKTGNESFAERAAQVQTEVKFNGDYYLQLILIILSVASGAFTTMASYVTYAKGMKSWLSWLAIVFVLLLFWIVRKVGILRLIAVDGDRAKYLREVFSQKSGYIENQMKGFTDPGNFNIPQIREEYRQKKKIRNQ